MVDVIFIRFTPYTFVPNSNAPMPEPVLDFSVSQNVMKNACISESNAICDDKYR